MKFNVAFTYECAGVIEIEAANAEEAAEKLEEQDFRDVWSSASVVKNSLDVIGVEEAS